MLLSTIHWASLFSAHTINRPPVFGKSGVPSTGGGFKQQDWSAFVTRFAGENGVDYPGFQRVQRLLRELLSRLSDARPDEWEYADEQLAFYLNAFNAIAIYEVLRRYPVNSIRDIPAAFARPYPVGPENLSLHQLLHSKIRAFHDPRVHAAIVPATASAPCLRAYTGSGLQQELDEQMRALLSPPAQRRSPTHGFAISRVFQWYAGDFAAPDHMPSLPMLLRGRSRPSLAVPYLRRYADPELRQAFDTGKLGYLRYDWRLNDASSRDDILTARSRQTT